MTTLSPHMKKDATYVYRHAVARRDTEWIKKLDKERRKQWGDAGAS